MRRSPRSTVTPIADVMLVLLVIFMVAAPLMTVRVPVQLPKTAAQKVSQPKTPLIVSIDKDGRVFVGQDELAPETIGPRLARAAGVTGPATLSFTLHRSGRVVSASITRSAGHPALDKAALATAAPGSSLPPTLESVPQQQMTISVPLRFDMR